MTHAKKGSGIAGSIRLVIDRPLERPTALRGERGYKDAV